MPYSEKSKVLRRLSELKGRQMRLAAELDETIDMARQEDLAGHALCSWSDISTALGTTRQATWERWRKGA